MKNKKWLKYTLGILLTLIVLIAVGGAGFRIGVMQSASFTRPAFAHNFDGGPQTMHGNFQGNRNQQGMQGNFFNDKGGPQGMQGNPHNRGFENRSGGHRDGGRFFSPIFGLIRLAVLGLLLWLGYKFVKNSGWRITRAQASPAPTVSETPSMEVDEKTESE